jgi:hypothetical protein
VERLSHIITSGFQFNLDSAKRGLLHSVLNEIINGFFLPDFNKVIGTDKENLEPLLAHLCDLPKGAVITLDRAQTIAFHNALRESLRELGVEEFDTRTGYRFEEVQRILRELKVLIDDTHS